jgi:DNA repair exonuclease SbcCD ATPase subunit
MISKIHIKNFQSHMKTELDFHPGVNTIIGSSDSGKSAIFRAITWIVTNRPLGSAFRRWKTKSTQVDLTVDEHITIGRVKGKSQNNYIFQDKQLLAGTEVPEDIQRILKIEPAINIQQQISVPFLLSNSPGEVAAFFNDIAGLSDIDHSIKNLKSWQVLHTRNIKRLDLDIEKQYTQLEELEYLEQAEEELERLEYKQTELTQIQIKQKQIKDLIYKYTRCSDTLGKVSIKSSGIDPINKLIQKVQKLDVLRQKVKNLEKMIQNHSKLQGAILKLDLRGDAVERIHSIENTIERLTQLQKQITKLKKVRRSWKITKTAYRDKQKEVEILENKISNMMPKICPLCGQEIP